MSSPNPRGNRAARRREAKRIANGEVNILASIPKPPEPAWQYWWSQPKREWMLHDPRVIEWIRCLQHGNEEQLQEIAQLMRAELVEHQPTE